MLGEARRPTCRGAAAPHPTHTRFDQLFSDLSIRLVLIIKHIDHLFVVFTYVQGCEQYGDQALECQNVCEKSLCAAYSEGTSTSIDLNAGATMLYSLEKGQGLSMFNDKSLPADVGSFRFIDDVLDMASYCTAHLSAMPPPPLDESSARSVKTRKPMDMIWNLLGVVVLMRTLQCVMP